MRWPWALLCALVLAGCKQETVLTDLVASAEKHADRSASASFRETPAWTDEIQLGGRTEPAITPPFPAEIRFAVDLPEQAELGFSVGVMTVRRVPRARVLFQVDVDFEGRSIDVYRREVRPREQNAFQEARVDLGAWGGKSVRLTLRTSPSGGGQVRWADRILTAWGNPVIKTRQTKPLSASERPSFVFILVDALRPDYLGSYGFNGTISPALDRLAMESVLFENCFANAPWTKPSVATLFTSLYPVVHGVTSLGMRTWSGEGKPQQVLPGEATTMAELFHDAGYQTAAFISNPHVSPRCGFSQGFDVFEWQEKTDGLLTAARRWLGARQLERQPPFFLYLHFMDVHGPYRAPRPDIEAILDDMGSHSERRLTEEEVARVPRYLREIEWANDEERFFLSSWRARYGAGVRAFDRKIRSFLDEMRSSGILDRTYIVLTADHGEELMEHGGWNHGDTLFDHQLHVPLLIRQPLAEGAGRRVRSLVSLIDLMPTLLAQARVEAPRGLQGRDFSALLRNEEIKEIDAVYASATVDEPSVYGARSLRHKIVWDLSTGEIELYDLESDPQERHGRSSEDQASLALMKRYLLENLKESEARGSLPRETVPLTDELRERLKALGYIQ